jgi:Flp pilus assembly protein TadD
MAPIRRAQLFDLSVKSAPHIGVRWYLRALYHAENGNYERAIAGLQQAVKLEPKRASFNNALARIYAGGPPQLRKPAEAVTLATRATELTPGEWKYVNTLGIAYFRTGRMSEAIAALEQSLTGAAGQLDAANLYFLALCHHQKGDSARARDCLSRAKFWHDQQRRTDAQEQPRELERLEAQELDRFRKEAESIVNPSPSQATAQEEMN